MIKFIVVILVAILIICTPITVFANETTELQGVMIPSNLTVEQLESGLLHDLKQYATYFIEAEKETGINAIFLASIAASEGGWYCEQAASNNIMGWTYSGGYMSFDSIEECIQYCSVAIKESYLSPDGKYFNGYTIEDVSIKYNNTQYWINLMNDVYYGIENRMELITETE